MKIADIRRDYQLKTLSEKEVMAEPIGQFSVWWDEAVESHIDEVNAMTLATANKEGRPSARIVLLKGFDEKGFVFFTNYQSAKARAIMENPRVTLLFFWKELERQVKIEGTISRISDAENDEYFNSRPEQSKIGAWASPQSQPIENREWLEKNWKKYAEQFNGKSVPRPVHWGGYLVVPDLMEFWQGRPGRLHDRIVYTKENGKWKIGRLAP
jgi:pyridoxamine 5'-phosphate oxidase